ncbi:hypothetical protein [Aeromicrobium yanjiei]|uniref:Uncharacterized protein n=1 Tax=Aeromicrobium yanjiei TaxID=2662028 RepID=A0A5Q2MH14_9ACTN|nr:hypothetical protein [Aeromicrobium yanjiei]QGG41049.1 hypothetical protein GEV26_06540 [Aeromicrobium yanjiei]
MANYTVLRTIYVPESFGWLRDKTSTYFRSWVLGPDPEDDLRSDPLAARWGRQEMRGETHCYAIVYPAGILYDVIGSGLLIRLENRRSSRSASGAPATVTRLYGDPTPNSISFEAHRLWDGPSISEAVSIAAFLSAGGASLVMVSLDDRVMAIKSNPTLSVEDRLVELDATVERHLPAPAPYPLLKESLRAHVSEDLWSKLPKDARSFLEAGQVAYDALDGVALVRLETSPAVIAYSKALESIVMHYLAHPFRRYVRSGHPIPAGGDGRFNRLKAFASADEPKPLELGTLASQLVHLDASNVESLPPTAHVYLDFLETLRDPNFLEGQLPRQLLHVSKTYRNPAAHPEALDFARLHEFVILLLGTDSDRGLFSSIVAAAQSTTKR